jgi:hypothetical protein
MNPITFPLRVRMKRPEVGDLQAAFRLLLDRGILLGGEEAARRELSQQFEEERASQTYGAVTSKLVSRFREERGLPAGNDVDESTAASLNQLLRELGVLDKEPTPAESGSLDSRYALVCRIVDARRQPIAGLRVEAWRQDPKSPPDLLSEPVITGKDGVAIFRFRKSDLAELSGERGPDVYFKVYRGEIGLEHVLPEIRTDDGVIRNFRPRREPILLLVERHYAVSGTIIQENGLPADKLALSVHNLAFGGDSRLLGSPVTDAEGRYVLAYAPGPGAVNLEIRTKDPHDPAKTIPLARPRFAARPLEVLNLVAPATPLEPEYRRLSADLTPHVGELRQLAQAREDKERHDLTVLNRATGWDARLIGLAAVTERLVAESETKLPREAVYGLLRAGLPSDKLMLSQLEPDVAEKALKTVRDAGIVGLSDQDISQFKEQFQRFANAVRLSMPAPGSNSTYGALLKSSGLPQEAQDKFVPVYLKHRKDGAGIWEEARKAGLDEGQVRTLRLQGKLAFLGGNSEAMTTRLMGKRMDDPVELVEKDLHRAEAWVTEILDQAGIPVDRRDALTDADRKAVDDVIPPAYTGEKTEARLSMYAEDMARKVRLSYPTQVVTRLIETDAAFKLPAAGSATVTLLKNASKQGFRLGETPVVAFLKGHPTATAGMQIEEARAAERQLQMLQRVYQVTPSNEAMPVLINLGMTSAYDIMAYSETAFVELFNAKYTEVHKAPPRMDLAGLIYRKARQVSSVTYNLFTIAKQVDSQAPVSAVSGTPDQQAKAKDELKEALKVYPTMESLFGSMDFCECDHCRSVLSPAAYFVDLLQFVDPESSVWDNFLATWKKTHNNQDYPHKDANGKAMKPYDVIVERRPDLPHIPLTCENTHTALPYIDIVNEILEYYVAHGKLEEQAVHDTGSATTDELLAEPQNVIREAYDKLRETLYPLNLPFDLPIETVRQFADYFDTPLDQVLEAFRAGDALSAPGQPFDRASIFTESLGLSPTEAALFTEADPLSKWYELYGFTNAAQATTEAVDPDTGQRVDLNSAKALARRLGVSYKEISQIVQTGFVNPKLAQLVLLYKMGVSIHDARFYLAHKSDPPPVSDDEKKRQLEVQAFADALTEFATAFQVTKAQLEAQLQAVPFGQILVLADPDAGCNFDLTTVQYSDGTKADAIAFLRINLFVRLWRKLGWSIEETDRALTTFVPQSAPFDANPANLAKQPLKTALIYLSHLRTLEGKVRVGKQSRAKLLTLWSDIATTGRKPLYAQLFLTRGVLKTAPVFDHPLGLYLSDLTIKLKDNILAVQSALGLTADEIGRILTDAGKSVDTAELSLANVSLLYRYGLLAKGLKCSVRELIALKQLSGLDPFKALYADPLATIEQDYPFSQTLRFVEIAETVKDSGLSVEDLDYLLRHRFDDTGKYRVNRDKTLALLKTLSEGVRAVTTEHAVPDDPGAMGEDVLRQKLGLVLAADVVERFLAMMNGTAEFTATKSGVAPGNQLVPDRFAGEPAIREVRYDAVRQEQKLTFRGVLFDAEKNSLMARLPKPVPPNPHVPSPILGDLLNNVQQQARSFFEKHLQKQAPGVQPDSGFLQAADFNLLFAPMPAGLTETQQQERVRQQRTQLVQAFLPSLQERLIRQFIVQTMTAYTAGDPSLVESLVTDQRLLADPQALLTLLTATRDRGVTAKFFASNDGTGATLGSSTVTEADTALKDKSGNPVKPAGANSARFAGYMEVPVAGAYRFYIELGKQNAEADLRFDHLPASLFLQGVAPADNTVFGNQPDKFLELKPGILYSFSLDLRKLNSGQARLLVQGETIPKGSIAQLTLYPADTMEGAERAVLLLAKVLQLLQGLDLTEREIRYLLVHSADFGGVNLSELPTRAPEDTPAEKAAAAQRFGRFLRLAAYSRLKRDLAAGTTDLIGLFEANGTGDLGKVYSLMARLTRRDEATVKTTAEALAAPPAFASEKPLVRLWDALQIVERFGVPVASLVEWTGIVSAAATADQRFEIARDLKEAIKARFEPETWQRAAQPIFDKLRRRERDALVSYVMRQHGFARLEQLYEYFLIDPGMEPVVQTSRIRLAIASVQLFIQRCLLNLEPKVHPSTITSDHWEWMKRYRVWEANRKIFLFPENWLEPEFRDDKTHLFTELEGALLQGDVSRDLVEDAFLNYLRKLDELARLDIVAMHIEDNPDPVRRTLHVFGRTYGKAHKYFYRRYAHQMWTPWEPVSAEIDGDHLVPVVWHDRLYLFWVTFLDKPDKEAKPAEGPKDGGGNEKSVSAMKMSELVGTVANIAANKLVEVQLHWSEYLQGEWTTRESGGFSTPVWKKVSSSFEPLSVFVHVSKEYDSSGEEAGVYIHLAGDINQAFYLAGRNSAPEKANYGAAGGSKPANPFCGPNTVLANRYKGLGQLRVAFKERITTEPGVEPVIDCAAILQQGQSYTLLPCDNNLTALGASEDAYEGARNPAAVKQAIESGLAEIASLMKPVFYQDNAHTFFAEPSVTERTIEEWEEWVTQPARPEFEWQIPDWWKEIVVIPARPPKWPIPDPRDPRERFEIDPGAFIDPRPDRDWLVNPATVLEFADVLIGPTGQPGLEIVPAGVGGTGPTEAAAVNVNPGSGQKAGAKVVVADARALEQSGLVQVASGLNVVGKAGFNSVQQQNFNDLNRGGFGSAVAGAARAGR